MLGRETLDQVAATLVGALEVHRTLIGVGLALIVAHLIVRNVLLGTLVGRAAIVLLAVGVGLLGFAVGVRYNEVSE
jgi:hypothetical protein